MRYLPRFSAVISILVLLSLILGSGVPVFADDGNSGEARFIVRFKPGTADDDMDRVQREVGGKLERSLPGLKVKVVSVPHGERLSKEEAYRFRGEVAEVEEDYVMQALDVPNDPYFSQQWGMTKVLAPEAWNITQGSAGVKIAIVDTGIDASHPDLAGKVVASQNFSTSGTPQDVNGHGTHVAGIAAAVTNNSLGVAGLGRNSSLMNVKVLNDSGSGYTSDIAQGIIWAADNGANVINLSLGGSYGNTTLQQAVDYAWNKGAVVVAAAGNSGTSAASYPAYYASSLAVAATDPNDRLYSWSNYGSWVDVAAPGSGISTYAGNRYVTLSGTSMASPHVAGLAGLVFTVATDTNGNGRRNEEVRALIENNADNIGIAGIGHGRINAFRAVSGSPTPPPPPPAPTTGTISGTVRDSGTGTGIAGATVSDGTRSAITGSGGSYTIANVPQGSYTLTASAAGYNNSSRAVSVMAGQTTMADFALVRQTAGLMWVQDITFTRSNRDLLIRVKVVSGTQPVGQTSVRLSLSYEGQTMEGSGTTNSSGEVTFRLRRARAGQYTATVLSLTRSGYTWDKTQGVTSASYTLR